MIIGKNTLTGTPTSASATSNKLLYGTGQEAVLSANQKLIGAYIGWGGKSANPTGTPTGEIGLFDVSGSNYTTAPKIFSVAYSFSNTPLSGTQWIFIPLDVDVSAHAGKALAPALACPAVNHAFDVLIETATGASRKNGSSSITTLQANLATSTVSSNQAWALYFETADIAPAVSITSINGGSAITAGKTSIASVSTGFTGLPVTITTNASGVTCSNIGGTTNAATFDISDRVDGGLYPKSGNSVNFTFTKGAESATGAKTVVKKATETLVAISSPLFIAKTLAQAILDQTGRTVATGDEFYYTTYSDLVITTNTDYTVTDAGSFELWLYVSTGANAGKNYFYSVSITEGGIVINGGITSSGLTSIGLSSVGLTSISL